MRQVDLAYIREKDRTEAQIRAKNANKQGDADRLQNITVPVIYPQVESATAYQSEVFLSGQPIFSFVSPPQYMDQAMAMNAIIEDNCTRGGWVRELMMFFRDGFKYNQSAIEVVWDRRITAAVETDLAIGSNGQPKQVIWEGNSLNRWCPYNTFWDTRVTPPEVSSKGEFIGKTEIMSRIRLKKFIAELPDKMVDNVRSAFESSISGTSLSGTSYQGESFYIPQINPDALTSSMYQHGVDWERFAGLDKASNSINYKNSYEVSTLYAVILPSDFSLKLPGRNTPQVWKFIIVNRQVLLYAERQTNAHDKLPVLMGSPLEDGLGYQTKSYAENVAPLQDASSGLMNSVFAARRRAISDRLAYDPSRISSSAINSSNPSAKIPVRPSAYGKNPGEAIFQFPFRDENSQFALQQVSQLQGMSNIVNGSNPARQGQFVKGNKTLHEFSDTMAHSNARDQMCSLLLEAQVFTPMKEILKLNILQYQAGTTIYSQSKDRQVQVDPIKLRTAVLAFEVSDGLTPTAKLINGDTFQVATQAIMGTPALAAEYNVGPMFSYLVKTQGADIRAFEKTIEQKTYEQAMMSWQQVVMEAIKQGASQDKLPPQPKPADYGYIPQQVQDSNPTPPPTSSSM